MDPLGFPRSRTSGVVANATRAGLTCLASLMACWMGTTAMAEDAAKDIKSAPRENTAVIPMPGGSDTWRARHQAMNDRAKEGNVGLVYIGDSIVGNWRWDGKPVWDHYYAKRQGAILGISGDRTQQVLWRLQHGNIDGISPRLAIVMIGQNNGPFNTGEEIAEGVTAIVNTLRDKLPETKILVLAIFQRGKTPTPERAVLAKANEIVSRLADGKRVFYLDINDRFVRPDGSIPAALMPDWEHPNEDGHRVWAEAIEPKVAELMGDAPVPPMTAPSRTNGAAGKTR